MILINKETLEVMDRVDESQLRELGMPEGFILADNLTTEEWIQLLEKAREQGRYNAIERFIE